MFSVFPYYGLEKDNKTILLDIKCHDSYLMKRLQNIILPKMNNMVTLDLPHLVSNVKTTSI